MTEQQFKIFSAAIAQLGERQTEDLKVPGSIPGGGSNKFFLYVMMCVSVAQWITHPSPKGKIAGSSPARDVNQITFICPLSSDGRAHDS